MYPRNKSKDEWIFRCESDITVATDWYAHIKIVALYSVAIEAKNHQIEIYGSADGCIIFSRNKGEQNSKCQLPEKNSKVYRAPFVDKNAAVLNALAYA